MFRVLAGCAFLLFTVVMAPAKELRPSIQRFFQDPVVKALDVRERDAACEGQLLRRPVIVRWIWVDHLKTILGDPARNRSHRIAFHIVHWSEDLASLDDETGPSSVPINPDAYPTFDRAESGLLGLISNGGGGWIGWDMLSVADLAGETDVDGARSKVGALSVRGAISALSTLRRSEANIMSERLRDQLRQNAFLALGHPGIAALVSLNSESMSAIDRWRNRNTAYLGDSRRHIDFGFDPKSPVLARLRADALTEREGAIRREAPSEAEADYRIAMTVDTDPDQLYGVRGAPTFVPRYDDTSRWLDRALIADPNHAAALRMKLELLVSEPIPWNANPHSDTEILATAERLRALQLNDPLPSQVIFANRQKFETPNGPKPLAPTSSTRPDGVPLNKLQTGKIDLSGDHLAGANLTNLYVGLVDGQYADFSDADFSLIDSRPSRIFSRFIGPNHVDDFSWISLDLAFAKLDRALIANRRLVVEASNTSFHGVRLENVSFDTTEMKRVDFRDAQLNAAKFYGVTWEDIDFSGARFNASSITQASLTRVSFKNADLADTQFIKVTLHGIDFSNADLSRVVFEASAYDCATRFPVGFRPDKAGLIALSDRCHGERTPRNIALSGKCKVPTERPLLPGTIMDGLTCEGNDLPQELVGVSMRHMKLGFAMSFYDDDLTDADLTDIDDNGSRFWPGFCESGGDTIVRGLIHAKRLDRAKLKGVTLQLFDAAAVTLDLSEDDLAKAIKHLAKADLHGAVLKRGAEDMTAPKFGGWHAGWAAANQEQYRFLSELRRVKGVIVDASCQRSAP